MRGVRANNVARSLGSTEQAIGLRFGYRPPKTISSSTPPISCLIVGNGFRNTNSFVSFENRRYFSTGGASSSSSKPKKETHYVRNFFLTTGAGLSLLSGYLITLRNNRMNEVNEVLENAVEIPVPKRQDQIAKTNEEYDILVVGGGATGAGVALDAATRGLKVCCVEQEDFASGTSSKSTKLLWAGSRYLVKALVKLFSLSTLLHPIASVEEFRGTWHMVMGCFRERSYMLQINPHLTYWVPIAVPMKSWIIWPAPFDYPLAALGPATGLFVIFFKFYDLLSLFTAPNSYVMTKNKAREVFPQLDGPSMKYVSVFYEGAHNDARTNLSIALTAMSKGATVLNYTRVDEIIFEKDEEGRQVARGAVCRDVSGANGNDAGQQLNIRAKKVIFCGGPYTDGMREKAEGKDIKKVVNGSGGTHIVLPQYYCPRNIGMVDMMTSRGSFLFFLPWQGYTLVGTTDVANRNPELHNAVPEDEVQYLVNECEKYLSPFLKVRRRDVMSAWYGTRPLCVDPHAADQSSVSRDHVVSHHPDNDITFISGGKWTTWREMAEDCIDQVLERSAYLKWKAGPCQTLKTPLVGAGKTDFHKEGYHENVATVLCQRYDLSPDVAEHLAHTYGTRADDVLACVDQSTIRESRTGLYKHYKRLYDGAACNGYPYLEAEIVYAVRNEHAITAADILCRRTRLAFLNSGAANIAVEKVVKIMGDELNWSSTRRKQETDATHKMLSQDFLGPIPNKSGATLRAACVADVQKAFDKQDLKFDKLANGRMSPAAIKEIAVDLGFPLSDDEVKQAIKELDPQKEGFVTFPTVLNWWNTASAEALNDIRQSEVTEPELFVPIQRAASVPSVFGTGGTQKKKLDL